MKSQHWPKWVAKTKIYWVEHWVVTEREAHSDTVQPGAFSTHILMIMEKAEYGFKKIHMSKWNACQILG